MDLQLIIGGSGMGKSTWLYNHIIREAMDNPDRDYIVLVPEQYTMETQRKLVMMHPNRGILNIDVLSFQRLSYRVMEELGAKLGEMLDDTGKNLIIRRCIDEHRRELKVLGGASSKIDFVPQIKAAVSELMQYDVSVEQVYAIGGQIENPQVAAKMQDIALIYDSFKQFIENHYLTTEELFTYVSRRIPEYGRLKNCVLALDGFTGFTPVQYRLLAALYENSERMLVTVPIDADEQYNVRTGISDLFYIGKETVARLYKMAEECGGSITRPVILNDVSHSRFAGNEAIYFLGKNLFAGSKNIYSKECDSILVIDAPTPMAEVQYAASQILQLTRQEGLRYRDIAVIAGNVSDYGNYAGKIFAQNEIPVFVDENRGLLKHSLVELIRSTIDVFVENYSYDSMMRFLKNSLLSLDSREIDLLDNYCLATGIRGRNVWNKPFDRILRNKKAYKIDLVQVNATREKIMAMLAPLEEQLKKKGATTVEMTEAIEEFLRQLQVSERIEENAKAAQESGDRELASMYEQVEDKVEALFTQIKELLKKEELSFREYAKVLDAGFAELQVGIIPAGMDYVLVGDMQRTRIDNKKVVFCLGLNEGKILNVSGSSLINNSDKQLLKDAGMALSPDDREKTFTQRLYLYMNVTKPSKRLYLSYSESDWNGQALLKSHLIHTVKKIFPHIGQVRLKNDRKSLMNQLSTVEANIYWERAELDNIIPEELARELYGMPMISSVTRMERFAGCAFAHFIGYGLELAEREQFKVEASDIGSVLHEVIEGVSNEVKESGQDFGSLDMDRITALVDRQMEQFTQRYADTAFLASKRNEELLKRIRGIAQNSIWAISNQLKNGVFEPYAFELPFRIKAGDGVDYVGKIDRVDISEDKDKVYVKIVDYKSGNESFDWTKIYYGLKLQLFTYMRAARGWLERKFPGKEIVPVAALYYHMDDPIVETQETDGAAVDSIRLMEMVPDGVICCDEEIVKRLDSSVFETGGKSKVIPAAVDKGGQLKITDKTISEAQFRAVEAHVGRKLSESTQDALGGHIEIAPVDEGAITSCTYCKYNRICGFDRELYKDAMRKFSAVKGADIGKMMNGGNNVD